MADSKKKIVELPTRKSAWSQVKKSIAPIGAGAIGGAGFVLGEALMGDVLGPVAGSLLGSLFIPDEVSKKVVMINGVMDSVYRMLE